MRAALIATGIAAVTALAGPAAAQATITISGPATTPESGTATYTITRTAAIPVVNADASVTVTTVSASASAPGDFTFKTQDVDLPSSLMGSSATFAVTIAPDTTDEADETFSVSLSNPQNDTLGTAASVTTTITDDDAPPTIAVGTPTPAAEGTGTDGPGLVFPVALSAPSGKSVTVNYATADGTASSAADYVPKSGTLTVPPGASTATVTVPVVPDATDEDDETVGLTLSAPANATLGATPTATGTIADDDTATLRVTGAVVLEGGAGTTTVANARVELSTPSARDVSVAYATVDGTATAPGDYTATSGRVTIPAGQSLATVPVTALGDAVPERDEVLGVRLSDPAGAALASDGDLAPIVLTNDDGAVVVPTTPVTPGTPTGPGAPSTGGGTATKAVTLGKPAFSRTTGRLRYKVTCPSGGGACRVALTVFSVPAAKSKVKALRSEQQLGRKTLTVPAGKTVTVELRLSTRARGWLRTARSIRTNAYAVSKDATGAYSTARVAATLKR